MEFDWKVIFTIIGVVVLFCIIMNLLLKDDTDKKHSGHNHI